MNNQYRITIICERQTEHEDLSINELSRSYIYSEGTDYNDKIEDIIKSLETPIEL